MSEFLGSRISLISKSDIRYSGVLHEINSTESTVSLENVKSFGTEGRRANPEEEIAPSDQIYEYIVFRGSDVKDLRIEQAPGPSKENQPPKVPDDPAIVGARPVANGPPGPLNPGSGPVPSPFGQHQYPPNFYPPPPGQWGRGGGPGPGPAQAFNMPYPPPPGWFPQAQGFPPGGPGPWNSFGYPPGPQGPQGPPGAPTQGMRGTPQQDNKPVPIGAGVDKQRSVGIPAVELPTEAKSFGQPPTQPTTTSAAPTPPVESKPSVAEVKATVESLSKSPANRAPEKKAIPTGPKNNRVTPALPIQAPIPASIPLKSAPTQVMAATASIKPSTELNNGPPSAAALRDATQAAKAAVAVAMAKLDNPAAAASSNGPTATNNNAMDNLTKKVNEMRVNAIRPGPGRGRGRGGRGGGGHSKVDVPDADFDFQTSNAKFNKQDFVKDTVAGSPVSEAPNGAGTEIQEPEETAVPIAYNKTTSFFDNISSESRERAENGGQKPGGREWRGEEQRKNMETFGQGSVDGGYRGGYRGRGRGRGNSRGRGFGPRNRGGAYRQSTPQ